MGQTISCCEGPSRENPVSTFDKLDAMDVIEEPVEHEQSTVPEGQPAENQVFFKRETPTWQESAIVTRPDAVEDDSDLQPILSVQIVQARELTPRDDKSPADALCEVCLGDQKYFTTVVRNTLDPVWDDQCFHLAAGRGQHLLQIVLWDQSEKNKAVFDFLGRVQVPVAEIKGRGSVDQWYKLQKRNARSNVSGHILLHMQYRSTRIEILKIQPQLAAMKTMPLTREEAAACADASDSGIRHAIDKFEAMAQHTGPTTQETPPEAGHADEHASSQPSNFQSRAWGLMAAGVNEDGSQANTAVAHRAADEPYSQCADPERITPTLIAIEHSDDEGALHSPSSPQVIFSDSPPCDQQHASPVGRAAEQWDVLSEPAEQQLLDNSDPEYPSPMDAHSPALSPNPRPSVASASAPTEPVQACSSVPPHMNFKLPSDSQKRRSATHEPVPAHTSSSDDAQSSRAPPEPGHARVGVPTTTTHAAADVDAPCASHSGATATPHHSGTPATSANGGNGSAETNNGSNHTDGTNNGSNGSKASNDANASNGSNGANGRNDSASNGSNDGNASNGSKAGNDSATNGSNGSRAGKTNASNASNGSNGVPTAAATTSSAGEVAAPESRGTAAAKASPPTAAAAVAAARLSGTPPSASSATSSPVLLQHGLTAAALQHVDDSLDSPSTPAGAYGGPEDLLVPPPPLSRASSHSSLSSLRSAGNTSSPRKNPRKKGSQFLVEVLEARDLAGKGGGSPYCEVSFGKQKHITTCDENDHVNPRWQAQAFTLSVATGSEELVVTVWGLRDGGKANDFLGKIVVKLSAFRDYEVYDRWFKLDKRHMRSHVTGDLHLRIQYCDAQSSYTSSGASTPSSCHSGTMPAFHDLQSALSASAGASTPRKKGKSPIGRTYFVEVVEASDLAGKGPNGLSDPIVLLSFGKQLSRTNVINQTLNPVWEGQIFSMNVLTGKEVLDVSVWSQSTESFLGKLSVKLSEFADTEVVDKWYQLEKRSVRSKVTGDIRLRIRYSDDNIRK